MSDPRTQRLQQAIKRRNACQERVQQIQGRLGAAKDEQARVEQECRSRGVKPDQLDAAIRQLEERFDATITTFEADIASAETKLAPFNQEDRP